MPTKDKLFMWNFNQQIDRCIHELRGIASTILFDKKIDDAEIELMESWLYRNGPYLADFPLRQFKDLFREIIKDGTVDESERFELMLFLESIADSVDKDPVVDGIFTSFPQIIFPENQFLFTGEFLFGERQTLENIVIKKHGVVAKSCVMDLNYLVVGSLGSEFYKYGKFGTKITKALKYNEEKKSNILIVKEKDFVKFI